MNHCHAERSGTIQRSRFGFCVACATLVLPIQPAGWLIQLLLFDNTFQRDQQVRQLTHGTARNDGSDLFNDNPTWSPDGTRLVFISNRGSTNELYSINAHGSGERRLTSDVYTFSMLQWLVVPRVPQQASTSTPQVAAALPSGSIVVAVKRPEGLDYDLYRFATPGGELVKITRHGSANYAPALSPDGTQIAYISNRDGDTVLALTDRNGSTFKELDRDLPAVDPILSVAWSPDGTQLVYQKGCDLYTVQANGSDKRALLAEPADQSACFRDPAWSPDGKQIVFEVVKGLQPHRSAIALVGTGGGTPTLLTEYFETARQPSSEQNPVFSPNGDTIAFVSLREGAPHVYLMNADGTSVRRLTAIPLEETNPAWSPDGEWIACVATMENGASVYAVAVANGAVVPLTDGSYGDYSAPSWGK